MENSPEKLSYNELKKKIENQVMNYKPTTCLFFKKEPSSEVKEQIKKLDEHISYIDKPFESESLKSNQLLSVLYQTLTNSEDNGLDEGFRSIIRRTFCDARCISESTAIRIASGPDDKYIDSFRSEILKGIENLYSPPILEGKDNSNSGLRRRNTG